ncbi:DUF481 domain-containing protein [Rudanella lutea]|uniref:DUF481 domain-containing protein n=1 Tax=Rudanella lutea TaxID=451374 RepID=UPI00035D4DE1|nr:DUF481 domain-containing protein [Rudanella lutea]
MRFCFYVVLLCFVLGTRLGFAQLTEQPDPLRPARPDTAQSAPRDSVGVVADSLPDEQPAIPTPISQLRYRLTADGTATRGNVNRFLLQLTAALDLSVSKQFKFSSSPSFVYGRQNALLNEREWFADFRTTYRHEKRLYYLAFGSLEKSNLRKIQNRQIAAGGVGLKLLNRQKAYLSLTNVLLLERTDFIEGQDFSVLRNSARLFGEYQLGEAVRVSHTTFWQPALNQTGNIRWNGTATVQVKMTDALSLRTTLANSYESVVVPGRLRNDLRWTIGLAYERK